MNTPAGAESSNRNVKVVSPIAEMMDRLRAAKYKANQQEMNVIMKCGKRMRHYGVEGFMAAGTIVWSVTGGINLLHRLAMTAVGAATGGFLTIQLSIKPCMEDILALDGSRCQEELVAILQREQADNPRLRKLLQQYYYLEPLYDDTSQGMPSVRLRRRNLSGESSSLNKCGVEVWGSEEDVSIPEHKFPQPEESENVFEKSRLDAMSQMSTKAPATNTRMHGSQMRKSAEEEEILLDPFDMFAWGSLDEESNTLTNKGGNFERRRTRMTPNERREHNRMRYLQWKEKQQQIQNEQSAFGS